MAVPYGDPNYMQARKSAFDVGDYGFGPACVCSLAATASVAERVLTIKWVPHIVWAASHLEPTPRANTSRLHTPHPTPCSTAANAFDTSSTLMGPSATQCSHPYPHPLFDPIVWDSVQLGRARGD
eukprot:136668-Chlamydomonas_euryale.AAC.2